jgi:hypothetical protein
MGVVRAVAMIATGIAGRSWRAWVTDAGAIRPWDGSPPLDWYVAADDRWHRPADEPAVRQRRIDGTPVTETRVRVPNGDVVQRIYSVADGGGITVIEIENESTMPVAVAFDRRDVLTERDVGEVPIEGIDLGPDAFVRPLGHRATLRIGIRHDDRRPGALPPGLPTATQVARGWSALAERAGRLVLPDGEGGADLAAAIVGQRCELALGVIPVAADAPAAFAVALGELVRMGEHPDPWIPELAEAVAAIGPVDGWANDVALAAAGRVLVAAGERRGRRDLDRIVARRTASSRPHTVVQGVFRVPWLESQLASGGALLPDGVPDAWLGAPIEAYGVPTGDTTSVSFAVRWHGARPAVLWEQQGEPIELSAPTLAPGWSSREPTGEALWPEPPNRWSAAADGPDSPASFS